MKKLFNGVPAFALSLGVHIVVLIVMWTIKMELQREEKALAIETVFEEERVQPEYTQDLETEMEVAEDLNPISGGMVSTQTGGSAGPTVAQQNIETSESLQDPDIEVPVGDVTTPGDAEIGEDLGTEEVTGDIGSPVEGYGAALSRLTQEIHRIMRKEPVMVVWLFDESESMKDDQEEISGKFEKVYAELGLVQEKDQELKSRTDRVLLTSILSYGEKVNQHTRTPTDDVAKIQEAIGKIKIDESGLENMSTAVRDTIRKFGLAAARSKPKRKLIVVVVSDESGDDGGNVEQAIAESKKFKAPIYVLGRESVFGFPNARYRWVDPNTNLPHWLPIKRGPETAYRECLQWDGIHRRWDSDRAGFGPYEMVRMAKESGGIFFILPGEEENLAGRRAHDERKFQFYEMRKYQPLLEARTVYGRKVTNSNFRTQISKVIAFLDPTEHPELNMRRWHYSTDPAEFNTQASTNFAKAAFAMGQLTKVIQVLDDIEDERATEDFDRWRAHYDLISAQVFCYRVRLFQYLLAMDQHNRDKPKVKGEKSNEWNLVHTTKMITPDEEQYSRIKQFFKIRDSREDFLKTMQEQEELSRERFNKVIENHPGTPWSRRAEFELSRGFGFEFREGFWDPRYSQPVKLPKL